MAKTLQSLFFTVGVLISMNSLAQLPPARELTQRMTVGVNLGNTLEAICDEGAWGAGKTSKSLIDDPANQGLYYRSVEHFNRYVMKMAVSNRIIPYYWDTHYNLFDRKTGEVRDRGVVNAMMQGAQEAGISPVH